MKNFRNFFRSTTLQMTCTMCSASVLTCIMTMISIFTTFCIFNMFVFKMFFPNVVNFFAFLYNSICLFVNNSFCLFVCLFITCRLKDSQFFFMESLPLHTSCLFSMSLNDEFLDIDKHDGICSLPSQIIFQDYFYIHQSLLLKIQDLHK